MTSYRGRGLCAAFVLLVVMCGEVCPAEPPRPPNVRSANKQVIALVREGCRRSATFHRLVDHIEASDLVVYVEAVPDMPPGVEAYLRWGAASATQRFVLVAIRFPSSTEKLLMLLGHELQHANEIADAPEVRDSASLGALYLRIGEISAAACAGGGPSLVAAGRWDSAAARSVGNLIRDELKPVKNTDHRADQ